jgi:hypothetical protein
VETNLNFTINIFNGTHSVSVSGECVQPAYICEVFGQLKDGILDSETTPIPTQKSRKKKGKEFEVISETLGPEITEEGPFHEPEVEVEIQVEEVKPEEPKKPELPPPSDNDLHFRELFRAQCKLWAEKLILGCGEFKNAVS